MEFLDKDRFDPQDPQPGVYLGVPEEVYFSCYAAVSKHMLDNMVVPARLRYEMDHPEERGDPSKAKIIGSLVDCFIFEPEEYVNRFVVPSPDLGGPNSKTMKAFKEEAKSTNRTVISVEDRKLAAKLKQGVLNNPLCAALLDSGYPQPVVVWEDRFTGVMCKGRLDWYNDVNDLLVDLKSAASATPDAFGKACANFRYDVQDQFYREGWREATGRGAKDFVFVVVEKIPPYCSAVYKLDLPARLRGKRLWRRDLTRYAGCLAHDEWPGFPDDFLQTSLPRWAYYEDND